MSMFIEMRRRVAWLLHLNFVTESDDVSHHKSVCRDK